MRLSLATILMVLIATVGVALSSAQNRSQAPAASGPKLPRTADGKPDFNGIWQALNTADWNIEDHVAQLGIPAGQSVVKEGEIPYQQAALAKRQENWAKRDQLDPTNNCLFPGVPRAMYMPFPFQIDQVPNTIAVTFEYLHVHRLVHMDGTPHPDGLDFWLGDSRGHWDGDTLVVDTTDNNEKTWFDRAGNYHSDALHVVERFNLMDPNTISYEATMDDPKTFTKPWTISMPLYRRRDKNVELLEYECLAYKLEQRAKKGQ